MVERNECLFCRVADGEIPATVVHADDRLIAFRDITPVAPTHVLVIPRTHYENVTELAAAGDGTLAALVTLGDRISRQEGHGGSFRLVFNTGADVGQSVFHAHGHVLAGRDFAWPPG
jgi:histidine triad (HIT) family protein